MEAKEFFGKFASGFLWGNILAMVLVVVALAFGVKYGLMSIHAMVKVLKFLRSREWLIRKPVP